LDRGSDDDSSEDFDEAEDDDDFEEEEEEEDSGEMNISDISDEQLGGAVALVVKRLTKMHGGVDGKMEPGYRPPMPEVMAMLSKDLARMGIGGDLYEHEVRIYGLVRGATWMIWPAGGPSFARLSASVQAEMKAAAAEMKAEMKAEAAAAAAAAMEAEQEATTAPSANTGASSEGAAQLADVERMPPTEISDAVDGEAADCGQPKEPAPAPAAAAATSAPATAAPATDTSAPAPDASAPAPDTSAPALGPDWIRNLDTGEYFHISDLDGKVAPGVQPSSLRTKAPDAPAESSSI
jgi:hypothetical protein